MWRNKKSRLMTKALFHLRQFRLLLLVLLCALFTLPLSAQEAYVEKWDNTTLAFYYDKNRHWKHGETWSVYDKKNYKSLGERTKRIVFTDSFSDYRPTSTARWFANLTNLTTIEGLENLNTSAVTDMSEMFYNCSSLTSLDLSNFNTSAVTDMGSMFSDCSGLTSLNLSNFNTFAVTNMEGMFYGCSGLKELNVSNFNASKVTDMYQMFYGCSSLTSLNLSNFNTSEVTDMRYMFYGCRSLRTILNPNTWRSDNSQHMFDGCTPLIGAVKFDGNKLDVRMANPTTGYFTDPNREYPKAYVLQSADQKNTHLLL